jgi:hypothetical protein
MLTTILFPHPGVALITTQFSFLGSTSKGEVAERATDSQGFFGEISPVQRMV